MWIEIINADIYSRMLVFKAVLIKYRHFRNIGIRSIETSFRKLKYTIGLANFHAYNLDSRKFITRLDFSLPAY